MDSFAIKRGDTLPKLRYLIDPASTDLTGASVIGLMRARNGASLAMGGSAAIITATGTPTVEYTWGALDTAVAGLFEFEFQVTFPGGAVQTFPRVGYIQVRMEQDISSAAVAGPPVNTVLPAITGAAQEGETLTATSGSWTNGPTGIAWQWRRGGTAISGATGGTYALVAADVGFAITVQVIASNDAGASAPAVSAATGTVTAASVPVPVNTAVPEITGTAQEGQTLTASNGTWTNSPSSFAYQWRRGGTAISGATAGTYALVAGDVGSTITVQVIASNAGGASAPAVSAATGTVTAASVPVPVNTAVPEITGTAQQGQTLTASNGTWTNSPSSFAYQWRRGGTAISGATASTYVPVVADVGSTLTVQVIASNAGGASAPAVSAATAVVIAADLFDFEIVDQAGSTAFTTVPSLRIQLGGAGTWHTLASASTALGVTLTLARGVDGKSLVISGWPGGVIPAGTLFHYEQRLPEEPNNASNAANALFARRVGDTPPVNTTVPSGFQISATVFTAPVGVT